MKKLLLMGALTVALFSCKKEKSFLQESGANSGKNPKLSTLDSPADQKDRTVLVVLISTLTKANMRTEDEARKAVFADTGKSLRTFYKETSGDRLFIVGKNNRLQGDVTSITVADPLLLDQCATSTWRTLSAPSLLLQGIVTSQYNTVIYITPLVSGCSNGIGQGGTPMGTNSGYYLVYFDKDGSIPIRQRTLAHELGHNIGLSHARTRDSKDSVGNPTSLSETNFTLSTQSDPSDAMGSSSRGEDYGRLYCASRLKSLGWLSAAEITTTSSVGTFTLAPLYGNYSDPRAIVIPSFIPDYDLWIETRQPFGIHDQFDVNKVYSGGVTETAIGTLVMRLVKTTAATGAVSTEFLDMHPNTTGFYGYIDAGLKVGETFSYKGKNIKLESVASNGVATVKIFGPPSGTLIPYGTTWKYLDNGSNQGTAWTGSSFDDSTWASGAAQLGYGPSSTATVVSYGPNASSKYVTTYFRKTINIDNPAYASITGNVKRDDGVAIYVNGVEVYRNNLATGASYTTKALSNASDNGATPQTFTISPSAFVAGNNTIAVEMHQSTSGSSDLVFDLEVKGNAP